MSYALAINLWLSKETPPSNQVQGILSAFRHVTNDVAAVPKAEAFSRPNERIDQVEEVSAFETLRFVERHWSEQTAISIETGFPLMDDGETVESPCSIRMYGRDYGHYHQARFGDIEIAFENVAAFAGLGTGSDRFRFEKAKNFDSVVRLVKSLGMLVRIEHLFLSTADTDVNPLTSHLVFHSRPESFVEDLRIAASLHEKGGAYGSSEPLPFSPWKDSNSYGHLHRERGGQYLTEFLRRTELIAAYFAARDTLPRLPSTNVETLLRSAVGVVANLQPHGILVYAEYGPSVYLDEAYWAVFSALADSQDHARRP